MEDCETLDLLRVEGRFLRFIAETHSELNVLEHVEQCETCRARIRQDIQQNTPNIDFGNLFQRSVDDPTVPQYSDYNELDNFIDARIHWRKNKLTQLLDSAELEIRDLQKRLEE